MILQETNEGMIIRTTEDNNNNNNNTLVNRVIWFHVSTVFKFLHMDNTDGFCIKGSMFSWDNALMASKTSFMASILPLGCVFLWKFLYVMSGVIILCIQ